MFSFSRHIYAVDLLKDFADTHSHILAGVDDGAVDKEESVAILSELEQAGVSKIYLTPHIKAGRFVNTEESLRQEFDKAKYESKIDLRLAAEYFVDDEFVGHIKGNPLTFADGSILVEFSFMMLGKGSMEMLFELTLMGQKIIIAHPERYSFMTKEILSQLTHSGYKLQLTIPSIIGYYGEDIELIALKMLDEGVYDYIGSDIHDMEYIEAMRTKQLPRKLFYKLQKLKERNLELY